MKRGVRLGLDGLDLTAQHGQGPPPQLPEHLGVAVLAAGTARAELAVDDAIGGLESRQGTDDPLDRAGESAADVGGCERAVGAAVTANERLERVSDGFGEGQRQSERDVASERIAVSGRIFGSNKPRFAGQLDLDRPPGADQLVEPLAGSALATEVDLGSVEVTDLAEHVVQLVGTARPSPVGHALQLELDIGQNTGVEQLAKLLRTE